MNEKQIDISDLNKADVLAALYNASRPLGMGFLQARPGDMTTAEAQEILDGKDTGDYTVPRKSLYFDYLYGRVMKVDLKGNSFDPWLYDRDNGEGAAQKAIDRLRAKATAA